VDSVADALKPCFAVAMTTSAVPVLCAAGVLDRDAVDELRGTLLAHLRLCVEGSAVICDLSQARVLEPVVVTRVLTATAVRAAGHLVRVFVLPCPGLPASSSATVPGGSAAGTFGLLDDMDSGLRATRDPKLERDDQQVLRILDRTIRHGLRDLRSQPPYDTLDPATCQALRWRLTDAAHAGVGVAPRLRAAAAGVRRALTSLNARQHQDAYFALLDAEDHLSGRAEPTSVEPTSVEPTSVEPTSVEPTSVEPTSTASPSLPAPRAARTLKPRTGSGPVGGTRGRVTVARRPPSAVTRPAGGRR
jgi:hypothetical protein